MKRYRISLILGLLIISVLIWFAGHTNTNATGQKKETPDLSSMQSKSMMFDTIIVTGKRPEIILEEIVVTAPHPNLIRGEKPAMKRTESINRKIQEKNVSQKSPNPISYQENRKPVTVSQPVPQPISPQSQNELPNNQGYGSQALQKQLNEPRLPSFKPYNDLENEPDSFER